MKRDVIRLQAPLGRDIPVSRGTKFGNLIFTQGVTARDLKTGELIQSDDMRVLARATLNNIKAIVEAGGSSMANVLSVTCHLGNIDRDFGAWNAVYLEFFPSDWPARTTVQAVMLKGVQIEVSVVACIPTP